MVTTEAPTKIADAEEMTMAPLGAPLGAFPVVVVVEVEVETLEEEEEEVHLTWGLSQAATQPVSS